MASPQETQDRPGLDQLTLPHPEIFSIVEPLSEHSVLKLEKISRPKLKMAGARASPLMFL